MLFLPFIIFGAALVLFAFGHMLGWPKAQWPWQKYKPQHPVVIVSVMLRDDNGRLLLGERIGKGAHGLLSTPGGKVDYHETLKHAAARELHEETGLLLMPGEFHVLGFQEHPNRYGGHYVTFYLSARAASCSGTVENREPNKCKGWEWKALDEFKWETCTEPPSVLAAWNAYWRTRAESL